MKDLKTIKLEIDDIIIAAIKSKPGYIRCGQEAFNTAGDHWPISTEKFRGGPYDPFYSTDMDEVDMFIDMLAKEVYTNQEEDVCRPNA